ncbi:hypothetical protein DFS34DRAFT_653522 [Phlyctochytrium arcticum]|nr:hypothetical protein DFS34DRAFT_653522 [Phlyctochytrium arcticum]
MSSDAVNHRPIGTNTDSGRTKGIVFGPHTALTARTNREPHQSKDMENGRRTHFDPGRKKIAVYLAAKSDNVSAVAELLGISEKNLYRWRKDFDIEGSETDVLQNSSEVRPLQELIRLSCPERTDEENIAVFLAGNQPPLVEKGTVAPTTNNQQEQLWSNEDLEFWLIEMVDKQLTATLNQVDQVDADANPGKKKKMFFEDAMTPTQLADDILSFFTEIVTSGQLELPPAAKTMIANTLRLARLNRQGSRSDSTTQNWDPRKEGYLEFWLHWAYEWYTRDNMEESDGADFNNPYRKAAVVTERKLLTWIRFDRLRSNPNLSYESVRSDIKAIIDLYRDQNVAHASSYPDPRDGTLLNTFKKLYSKKSPAPNAPLLDKALGTIKDGYDKHEFLTICNSLLHTDFGGPSADMYHLRAVALSLHMLMSRSENVVGAKLSDLILHSYEDKKPLEMKAVILHMWESKTNPAGRLEGTYSRYVLVECARMSPVRQLAESRTIATETSRDRQAMCFVEFMEYLAIVFLQDAPELKRKYPHLTIWYLNLTPGENGMPSRPPPRKTAKQRMPVTPSQFSDQILAGVRRDSNLLGWIQRLTHYEYETTSRRARLSQTYSTIRPSSARKPQSGRSAVFDDSTIVFDDSTELCSETAKRTSK